VVSITPRPRFTPGERAPGTHCTGGWVGPRDGLHAEVRGKTLCLCRGSNPGRPVRSQTLLITCKEHVCLKLLRGSASNETRSVRSSHKAITYRVDELTAYMEEQVLHQIKASSYCFYRESRKFWEPLEQRVARALPAVTSLSCPAA
jgi:hypothetical protein